MDNLEITPEMQGKIETYTNKLIAKNKKKGYPKNEFICFRYSNNQKEKLNQYCEKYNVSASNVLREMLDMFLESKEKENG